MSKISPTVLIAHQDSAARQSLIRILRRERYVVRCAEDNSSAMAAVQSDCPNILIAFAKKSHDSGLELCRWLRSQNNPHYVYVVFLSDRIALADVVELLEAGADDIVHADIDDAELLARLHAAARIVEENLRLSHLAITDPLTGLENQRALQAHLSRECSRSIRYQTALTCAMIDVDHFKKINDSLGHGAGNVVIARVADTLKQQCRESDVVCRYGGDEFCVILTEADEQAATIWAERIRKSISELEIAHDDKKIGVKISLGVAQRLDSTVSSEELINSADQALLHAKRSGRDRVVGYQSLSATAEVDIENVR